MCHTPDALIIGPQRAGTTWIHNYLASRKDICLPRGVKETFFFDRYFSRGLPWYKSHFLPQASTVRTIEVAPSYFHHEDAPRKILDCLGEIPLVCTLRNPITRTHSLYLHQRRYGAAHSFRQAVKDDPAMVESSKYATLLRRWWNVFGQSNVAVLFLEDLALDPNAYAQALCQSLGLSFHSLTPDLCRPVNEPTTPPSKTLARIGKRAADVFRFWGFYGVVEMAKSWGLKPLFFGRPGQKDLPVLSDHDRRWLAAQFAEEIDELEQMLDVDLSHWREYPSRRAA